MLALGRKEINNMEIFKTTRQVEKIKIDENDFLKFLKNSYPNDEDIQKIKSLDEIEKYWGISEFDAEIEEYCIKNKIESSLIDSYTFHYTDYDEAYEDMEWGIH